MTRGPSGQHSWTSEIERLKRKDLYRIMPAVSGLPGRTIMVNGRSALNFSSNNYLGLAGHPTVAEALVDYTRQFGAGSTASRLIAGNSEPFRELESFIAAWKQTESALVFATGYQANVGILTSLVGEGDLILSDELNHASIIDGCRLSRAAVQRYPHLDLDVLDNLLKKNPHHIKLVVTESIFSMDGDRAPLKEIHDLCRSSNALLMVDEAHATGVLGPQGQGLAAEVGIIPDIQMGTMGKAVGTSGAFVAGPQNMIDLLTNKARSLLFTTAPPPGVIGSSLAALRIIASAEGEARRATLAKNGSEFTQLASKKLDLNLSPGHIVPIVVGESARTMKISARCLEAGVFAHGIRYPTVPEGTSRLRFSLMSDHTAQDLSKAVTVLERVLGE
jgi:8-amino-7-oxononanoate synthase